MLACRSIDKMAGGVERQIVALANGLASRRHQVGLFTSDQDSAESFYKMDSKVCWYRLGMGNPTKKAPWLLRLRRMVKVRNIAREFRPDIVAAFQPGTFIGLRFYTLGMGLPMVASLRNAPSLFDFTSSGRSRKRTYQLLRMADKITVQFPCYRDELPAVLHNRTTVIPNAIYPAQERAYPDQPHNGKLTLLAVGRLSFQKNYHLLIRAFGQLAEKFSNWTLAIAGEGDERKKLEQLAGERVQLLGNIDGVEKLYTRAHLFCQPSLWEGFPNALSEALSHGLPAVGFGVCSGVNELIAHGQNGLLAKNGNTEEENIESLKTSLENLMASPELRKSMGARAVESMRPYSPERCFDQWERVLGEVVG